LPSLAGSPIASYVVRSTVRGVGWTELRQRTLAFGLGVALTLAGLWTAGVVLVLGGVATQPPDPLAPDYGDPCCPVPNTWMEVSGWSVLALVAAAVDAGLLMLGGTLLLFAFRGRWPRRRVALVALAVVPMVAGLILFGLLADATV
jgi:hypothetical protein